MLVYFLLCLPEKLSDCQSDSFAGKLQSIFQPDTVIHHYLVRHFLGPAFSVAPEWHVSSSLGNVRLDRLRC